MHTDFKNKIVIVTGGAMGIGQAAAAAFAREGAAVVIADINEEQGDAAAKQIDASGGRVFFQQADAAVAEDAQKVVRAAVERFGGVDILFNNVGIQPTRTYLKAEDLPEEDWDRIMAVNAKSHFLMAKYAIPEMRKRGGGVIINNASVQGLASQKLVPAYAASKGAVLSLTRNLALDYAQDNIRVVAVCPGAIETPLLREAMSVSEPDDLEAEVEKLGRAHPLGRVGTPEEVAEAVIFLASARASFITGDRVCVDGGLMAQGSWSGAE